MAWKKYNCTFYSQNKTGGAYVSPSNTDPNQQLYEISIWKETGADAGSTVFKCTEEGFVLTMDGGGDNIASPIKTTSVEFDMIIEGAAQEAIIADILSVATGNENEFYVQIARYDVGNTEWINIWRGPLLGDLVSVQDVGINNIIKVQATDGLTQLKYKNWDGATHGGIRTLLYIIKACLQNITLTSNRYSTTDAFIAHIPCYYNKGMAGGLTGANAVDSATWRENVDHDPLALTLVNTELFKYDDGERWSYYHILEQVLSAMQLRIMMCEIDGEGTGQGAMWFLQSPFVYHDSSGTVVTQNLLLLHGNNLSTESALAYDNDFSTKLKNPNKRTTGGLTTYIPPLLSYKSVYDHKIMQNLIFGPLSFNSFQYSQDVATPADDLYLDTPTGGFELAITEDNSIDYNTEYTFGLVGDVKPSSSKILITGEATYYPYHWSGWDFYNQNNEALSGYGDWTRIAYVDQHIYWRMGLAINTEAEWSDGFGSHDISRWHYLGDTRAARLYGSISWIGPSESDAGAGNYYAGYGGGNGVTWPNELSVVNANGQTEYLWGTDQGYSTMFWNISPDGGTAQTTNTWYWFSPMYMTLNDNILGTADTYAGYNAYWQYYKNNTQSSQFAIYTPALPLVGSQYETYPNIAYIRNIRFTYALKRDMWDNDGNNDYWTCALDWSNQKELLHENRGIGYGCNLNNVRVYYVGNENYNDGYYDFSIGYYSNANGTPSEGEIQDPEIIIGDMPEYYGSFQTDNNEGVQPVYFGQFWIKNTNSATNTLEPYYIHADSQKWINIWEDLSTGDPLKLHLKRCKNQIAHHYKLKQRLDLNFIDRSVGYNSVTDYRLSSYGFSGVYVWENSGSNQTENTDWEDIAFIPTGGTFVAGTMEWKLQLTDASTFSESNLVNNSYNSNNAS